MVFRKQNLFIFYEKDTELYDIQLQLVNSYMNRFVIEEEAQFEVVGIHRAEQSKWFELEDLDILLESLKRAKLYQNEISDTHFIIGHSTKNPYGKSSEISAKKCDSHPLLALGKPYEETVVIPDLDDLSDTEREAAEKILKEAWDAGHEYASFDASEVDGYIVWLHKWIYRVAKNMGLKSLQISFLQGFRKTLATAEELKAASEGHLISRPQNRYYHSLPNVEAANHWLSTFRSSLNDDIESFLTSIKKGFRKQSSMPIHLYKMLTESGRGSTYNLVPIGPSYSYLFGQTGESPCIPE